MPIFVTDHRLGALVTFCQSIKCFLCNAIVLFLDQNFNPRDVSLNLYLHSLMNRAGILEGQGKDSSSKPRMPAGEPALCFSVSCSTLVSKVLLILGTNSVPST